MGAARPRLAPRSSVLFHLMLVASRRTAAGVASLLSGLPSPSSLASTFWEPSDSARVLSRRRMVTACGDSGTRCGFAFFSSCFRLIFECSTGMIQSGSLPSRSNSSHVASRSSPVRTGRSRSRRSASRIVGEVWVSLLSSAFQYRWISSGANTRSRTWLTTPRSSRLSVAAGFDEVYPRLCANWKN